MQLLHLAMRPQSGPLVRTRCSLPVMTGVRLGWAELIIIIKFQRSIWRMLIAPWFSLALMGSSTSTSRKWVLFSQNIYSFEDEYLCQLDLADSVQMTNGGTGPYKGSLLFVNSGRGILPSSLTLVNFKEPYNVTVLVDNFFGRQFNSLNDVKIHPSGNIFFTDVTWADPSMFMS